jgi:hypothetical protein
MTASLPPNAQKSKTSTLPGGGMAIVGTGSIGRKTSALQKKIVLSLSFRQ